MANAAIRLFLTASNANISASCFLRKRLFFHAPPITLSTVNTTTASSASAYRFHGGRLSPTVAATKPSTVSRYVQTYKTRSFTSSSSSSTEPGGKINTKVNFSPADSDEEEDEHSNSDSGKQMEKTKLPPPYDPFSKKPVIEDPEDPKDLQEIFHKMRTEGLLNNAVKMFDALSKDGLTHEALELFAQIKDKGHMPDVVGHTAVIEAYANAGKGKEAHKVFIRMLACGVKPNAYTYSVLIRGLASDPKLLSDAKKCVMEMMGKGMQPNAGTYTAVFEAFARESKVEEGRQFLEEMKGKGFEPDEQAVRDLLKAKSGQQLRSVINILFAK